VGCVRTQQRHCAGEWQPPAGHVSLERQRRRDRGDTAQQSLKRNRDPIVDRCDTWRRPCLTLCLFLLGPGTHGAFQNDLAAVHFDRDPLGVALCRSHERVFNLRRETVRRTRLCVRSRETLRLLRRAPLRGRVRSVLVRSGVGTLVASHHGVKGRWPVQERTAEDLSSLRRTKSGAPFKNTKATAARLSSEWKSRRHRSGLGCRRLRAGPVSLDMCATM